MEKTIELSNENIDTIKYDDIVAITIAEAGAMGESNGFYVVMKNCELYHTNLGNTQISNEKMLETFPLLKTFDCFCGNIINLNDEWKYFYMGFGNYLVVRKEYYEIIMQYIKENLPKDFQRGYLYQKWYDIITKVVK